MALLLSRSGSFYYDAKLNSISGLSSCISGLKNEVSYFSEKNATPTTKFLQTWKNSAKSRWQNNDWWLLSFIQLLTELFCCFRPFVNLSGVLINGILTTPMWWKKSEFSTMASLAIMSRLLKNYVGSWLDWMFCLIFHIQFNSRIQSFQN